MLTGTMFGANTCFGFWQDNTAVMVAKTDHRKRKGANALRRAAPKTDAFETEDPATWLALLAKTVATVAFAAGAALDGFAFSLAAGVPLCAKGHSAPRLHVPFG